MKTIITKKPNGQAKKKIHSPMNDTVNGIYIPQSLFKLILFFAFIPTLNFAQPASARVSFTPDGPSNAVGMCHVTLHDSTGIQSIEVELTDLMKKEVLFTREYVFDQTSGLPTGITWHREGTKVQLGIGTLPKKLAWQGKVRLKDGSGVWGEAYTFLFN